MDDLDALIDMVVFFALMASSIGLFCILVVAWLNWAETTGSTYPFDISRLLAPWAILFPASLIAYIWRWHSG